MTNRNAGTVENIAWKNPGQNESFYPLTQRPRKVNAFVKMHNSPNYHGAGRQYYEKPGGPSGHFPGYRAGYVWLGVQAK